MIMRCDCKDSDLYKGTSARNYIKEHLQEVKSLCYGWEKEYICPDSQTYWLEYYPYAELQNEGTIYLRKLTSDEVEQIKRLKYFDHIVNY